METSFCQSCGRPMMTPKLFGTNANGTLNIDYCRYCFQNGTFTQDFTMEEMMEHCARFPNEFNLDSGKSHEEAIAQMKTTFPKLKRWKKSKRPKKKFLSE